jgi:hypothetical protein
MPGALHLAHGPQQSSIGSGSTNYASPGEGPVQFNATENNRKVRYGTRGSGTALQVNIFANTLNGSTTIKSRRNGDDGNMQVSVASLATGIFEESSPAIDNIFSGDDYNYVITTGGTSGSISLEGIGHIFTADASYETMSKFVTGFNESFTTASTSKYAHPAGQLGNQGTEANLKKKIHSTGVLKNLYVNVTANSRNSSTTTVVVRKNGADTALKVDYLAGTSGIKEETAIGVDVADGDEINLAINTGSGSGTFTAELAALEFITTNDKYVAFNGNSDGQTANPNTSNYVAAIAGRLTLGQTESRMQMQANVQTTISKLSIHVSTNGITNSSTVYLRKNATDTSLDASIPASTSGYFEDLVDIVEIIATDLVNYRLSTGSGGTNLNVRGILSTWIVVPNPHNLLSLTHPDTTSASVSRGDIVSGQGSPTSWQRKALGSSGYFLKSDGTDLVYAQIAASEIPTGIDASKIADGSVSNSEFQYLGSVTSDIQTQLNGKAPTVHTHPLLDLTNAGGATGDIIYWNGTNWVRLPKGLQGKILSMNATIPEWTTVPLAYTWIIYKSGSNYIGRKWDGSANDYSSASFDTTLGNVLSAVSSDGGGRILVHPMSVSTSAGVNMVSNCILEFAPGFTWTMTSGSVTAITASGVDNWQIIGNKANFTISPTSLQGNKAVYIDNCENWVIDGIRATLYHQGGESNAIEIHGTNTPGPDTVNGIIRNCRLVNNKRGVFAGVSGDNLSDIWAYNNWVNDTSAEGIRINRCTRLFVIGNTVVDSTNNGIDVGINNSFVTVVGNQLLRAGKNPALQGSAHGIDTDRGNFISIVGNTLDDSRDIKVQGAKNVSVSNNILRYGNTPDDDQQGINVSVSNTIDCDAVVISSNIIDCNNISLANGIYLGANQTKLRVYGNIIKNVHSSKKAINDNSGSVAVVFGNEGWKTENTVLSGTQTIDSTGVKTVTIAHGLNITPNKQDCAVFYVDVTDTSQVRQQAPFVSSVDATNVVVKFNVTTAGTSGSTCRVGLRVGRL